MVSILLFRVKKGFSTLQNLKSVFLVSGTPIYSFVDRVIFFRVLPFRDEYKGHCMNTSKICPGNLLR